MRTQLIIILLLLSVAVRGRAQTGVSGIQPLAFGTLLPGVAETIQPTNPGSSGEFTLTGNKNEQVSITFSLPSAMTGPHGATLPLTFGATSGGYSRSSSTSDETAFDPRQTQTVQLAHNGTGEVFLGGTANPGTQQRAGSYSATVTLSATFE